MITKDPRIAALAAKYEKKVVSEFQEYVDFAKVDNMTTNIFILSPEQCVGEHEDIRSNLGKCLVDTGEIFLRETGEISERLFIHEYIHRLSRNKKGSTWYMGIQTENEQKTVNFNEAITEYFCWKVVGYDKKHSDVAYSYGLDLIEALVGEIQYEQLLRQFFYSDADLFASMFGYFDEICADFDVLFQSSAGTGTKEEILELALNINRCKMHFMSSLEDDLYFPHTKKGNSLLAKLLDRM